MGIKLKDYIENPYDVFTEEEAIMLYQAAGYIDLESLFAGYTEVPLRVSSSDRIDSEDIELDEKSYSFATTIKYTNPITKYRYGKVTQQMQLNISDVGFEGVA